MKQYYNKMTCNAAFVLRFMRCESDVYKFQLDDGQEYVAYQGSEHITGVTKLIKSSTLYEITHSQEKEDQYDQTYKISYPQRIEYPLNEWIVPSVPVFLVERYDMNDDEMRVAVVEEQTFQSNFYPDEPSNLIEIYSVEKSNHQYRS